MDRITYIIKITGLSKHSVTNTDRLLQDKATIPFISRYRKEATGNLDEVEIFKIQQAGDEYDNILKRQTYILSVLKEKKIENAGLIEKIKTTFDLNRLEDLYLPYKSKRKTKAEQARQAGLEGLAKIIMKQENYDPLQAAGRFTSENYPNSEAAIEGALFIIADWMNENDIVRDKLRKSFLEHGVIHAKVVKSKKEEADKYRDFFDFSQRIQNLPSYRLLALLRGVDEGFIRLKIEPNKEYTFAWLERFFIKNSNEASQLVNTAIKDAYKRLLQPSLETETKNHFKNLADEQSILTFSKNLEKLLLAPPLGAKRVLAIDPGFKSGCKVVCLDEQGQLLTNVTIFPHPPQKDTSKASAKISQLVQAYKIEVIAIGDGTAGRETEQFIKRIHFDRDLSVFVVREDGASIYSASKIGREEFPEFDVTVRGAVSIGRRLMDPLAELVKIDPKSLGVGQYQHDVNQTKLQEKLDHVVEMTVNRVGVNLNTASKYLLAYVAGLGPKLAENIIEYRKENGRFESRLDLKKVARLGENAFQQSAGFLRIKNPKNPLDNSAVHPEHYQVLVTEVERLGMKIETLIGQPEKVKNLKNNVSDEWKQKVGEYTVNDIFQELEKPGNDPRAMAKVMRFSEAIKTIDDIKIGMKLNGVVTNVTDFGAFVNIGIKENGLIHKTELSDEYVSSPVDFIALHDHVSAVVVSVDVERKRIGLSIKKSRL